jgi:hypothetical protein
MTSSLTALARTVVPSLNDVPISVVRIQTTRPVYLLFGRDDQQPACVAQVGDQEALVKLRDTLQALHSSIPDLVAESFGCLAWGTACVHFQEGLPGLPWFRLHEYYHGEAMWTAVRQRGLEALETFHGAVAAVPRWRGRVNLRADFDQQVRQMHETVAVSPTLSRWLQSLSLSLEPIGEMDCHWQHGDYCLNNLLIGRDGVRIVDFDEFGETSFPGQDETGLALSIHEQAADSADWNTVERQLRSCLVPVVSKHPRLRPCLHAIAAHYLVRRISRCAGYPSRQPARLKLEAMLASGLEALTLA